MSQQNGKHYDFVIIGSGLGGLMCARILGMHGFKVVVLEKNRQFGGNLQTFARNKCVFDTGVHYLGGLDPGQNLHQFFKYAGILDKLKLKRMDVEGFDIISFEGDPVEYPHGMGYDHFISNLAKLFPHEKENLKAYCEEIKHICTLFPMYNLSPERKTSAINKYFEIGARELIEQYIQDEKLRAVIGGSNLLYAGDDRSPAYVHALVTNSYIESSWRCVNGGSQISIALVRAIKELGGEVVKYAEVNEFYYHEDGTISGVGCTNGNKYYGDNFISNLHPTKTIELAGEEHIRNSYVHRIKSIENTTSLFSVHAVFKPESFPYINHNFYHYRDNDPWVTMNYTEEEWPKSYMLLTPATTKSDQYADSCTLMAYMHFEEVEEWKDTFNTVTYEDLRSESYQEFKLRKAEKFIDVVEERFPGFRDSIETYYTSTPLSYRDYINTPNGSAYGIFKSKHTAIQGYVSPRTKIRNLFLTGQNLNMHGILGVTVGAVITSSLFVDSEKLINDIRNA